MNEHPELSDSRRPSPTRRFSFVVFAFIPLLLRVAIDENTRRSLPETPDNQALPGELFGAIVWNAQLLWDRRPNLSSRDAMLGETGGITGCAHAEKVLNREACEARFSYLNPRAFGHSSPQSLSGQIRMPGRLPRPAGYEFSRSAISELADGFC